MERPTEGIKKLQECVSDDACDAEQCEYFNCLGEIQAVLAWAEELEKENKELKAEIEEIYDNPGEWLAGL